MIFSTLYTAYGPAMAWNMEFLVCGLTLALWLLFYRRMVPLVQPTTVLVLPEVETENADVRVNGMALSKGPFRSSTKAFAICVDTEGDINSEPRRSDTFAEKIPPMPSEELVHFL